MRDIARLVMIAATIAFWGCDGSSFRPDGDPDTSTSDVPVDTAVDDVPGEADTTGDPVPDDTPPVQYSLHEWGVMVMGPDGATVHGPTPEYAGAIPAKPVIYLYAQEAFDLDLGITFSSGEATETWPEVAMGPVIAWTGVHVDPVGACTPTPFPSAWSDPWTDGTCEACTLGSVVVPGADCLTAGDVVAQLLFYTGTLPDYEPPVAVAAGIVDTAGGRAVEFDMTNSSSLPVEDIWVVYRNTTDSCIDPSACGVVAADIAWQHVDSIAAGESLAVTAPIFHHVAAVDEWGFPIEGTLELSPEWLGLGEDLEAELVERGLYEPEAQAFINAWDTVYFGLMGSDSVFIEPMYRNGASITYFMSRADYDAELALDASPSPAETVRVGMVYQNI